MIFTLLPCSGITLKKREWISFKIRLSWVSGKSQGTHLKSIITNTNIQTQTQTCLISEKKNQNSRKERNKMPETENRPRGEEVRSQREERQCLHTNKTNKLLVAECIDNDIIDMTSSLIEIALRIRVQHFFFDRPRKMTRTAAKKAKAKEWHMSKYTNILPVECEWERERESMCACSQQLCVCVCVAAVTLTHAQSLWLWQHAMFLYVCRLLL